MSDELIRPYEGTVRMVPAYDGWTLTLQMRSGSGYALTMPQDVALQIVEYAEGLVAEMSLKSVGRRVVSTGNEDKLS